jgi:hypothetical protein
VVGDREKTELVGVEKLIATTLLNAKITHETPQGKVNLARFSLLGELACG